MAVGYLLFLRIDTSPSYVTVILPAVLLIGVGWIGFPAVNIQATSGVDDDEQGLAAGVLQTSMQVGAAVVLAVTTAMITSGTERRHHAGGGARRASGPGSSSPPRCRSPARSSRSSR